MTRAHARTRRRTAALMVWVFLAVLTTIVASPPSQAVESPVLVPSNLETTPVLHSGDAMDDPSVWVNPSDSTRSLVIGNDKGGALESYDLRATWFSGWRSAATSGATTTSGRESRSGAPPATWSAPSRAAPRAGARAVSGSTPSMPPPACCHR